MSEISTTNPDTIRFLAKTGLVQPAEIFKAEPNGHKFKAGQSYKLVGLEDFPEYNGQTVKISSVRENGLKGKAYYIEGKINEMINWVYEYRLEALPESQTPPTPLQELVTLKAMLETSSRLNDWESCKAITARMNFLYNQLLLDEEREICEAKI